MPDGDFTATDGSHLRDPGFPDVRIVVDPIRGFFEELIDAFPAFVDDHGHLSGRRAAGRATSQP